MNHTLLPLSSSSLNHIFAQGNSTSGKGIAQLSWQCLYLCGAGGLAWKADIKVQCVFEEEQKTVGQKGIPGHGSVHRKAYSLGGGAGR